MAVHNIESFVNRDGTSGHSLNIVKGCNGPAGNGVHCLYCYAKKIVNRFDYVKIVAEREFNHFDNVEIKKYGRHIGYYSENYFDKALLQMKIKSFKPHFFEYVYAQKLRLKPTTYFFSMSDPADWEQSWYERILEKIKQYPQHTFVVLTKRPRKAYKNREFPQNCWLGITATNEINIAFSIGFFAYKNLKNKTFLSVEPIQGKIRFDAIKIDIWKYVDWFIVGPETGTHKKTPVEWLDPFFSLDIPVFMKDSWKKFTDKKLRQEWPEGYRE